MFTCSRGCSTIKMTASIIQSYFCFVSIERPLVLSKKHSPMLKWLYSTLWGLLTKHVFFSFSSQPLHKDDFGLCEQQWERCVCPQQHSPHLPGGGQPHHGLWRHFTSALCCHLLLCESSYVCAHVCEREWFYVCVLNCGCVCSWWLQSQEVIHPHWPFPITLDYS